MEAFWQQKPGELKVVGGEAPLWRAGLLCRHCSRDCFSPALSGCQKLLCQEPALSGPYPSCSHFRHRFGRLGMERWPGFSGTVWLLSPLFYQGGQIFLFSAPINYLGEPSRDGWGGWFSSTPGAFAFGCFLPSDPISRSDFPVRFPGPGDGSERIQAAGSFHFPAGRRSSRAGDPSSSLSQREVTRVAGYRHCPKARGTFVHIYRSQSRPFGAMAQVLFFRGGQVLSGRSSGTGKCQGKGQDGGKGRLFGGSPG